MKTATHKQIVPPGDDVCPVPAPVDEVPDADRFCDLVLTGGVASGVVYPWAIVELARAYRFRNIGGTSVGAMAATLAAAAEYGRRTGVEAPFEVLRRLPAALGEVLPDKRTRMLSLFQTAPRGRRLIKLWGRLGDGSSADCNAKPPGFWRSLFKAAREIGKLYALPMVLGALVGLVLALGVAYGLAAAWSAPQVAAEGTEGDTFALLRGMGLVAGLLSAAVGALAGLVIALWGDIKHGLIKNDLGLCKGGTLEPAGPEGPRPGICEWLHEGIQASAGLELTDPPLTFRDLWSAPAYPGARAQRCADADPPGQRAINLQMITSNVTHGRPYRLPLADETSRLFFKPDDLRPYLPPQVLAALEKAAKPYAKLASADPEVGPATAGYLQLPGADMPVLVAARLSLSFPLLFSAVPLYAIDYEPRDRGKRRLKRCLFTDGGVSSNFPIHLFDAALPRWPTFGLWLDRHNPNRPLQNVWLPKFHRQGWGDNWNRFDPAARAEPVDPAAATAGPEPTTTARGLLWGYVLALSSNALDWRDRTSFRLPHVRNRVARLLLRRGEGGLNIGMPRPQILLMARRYGTAAGRLFVKRFAEHKGVESPAWREQRWVRMHVLINGLRERLDGVSASAAYAAHSQPLQKAIKLATREAPLRERERSPKLSEPQADSLSELVEELKRLERLLQGAEPQAYKPTPEPELRLRAPL